LQIINLITKVDKTAALNCEGNVLAIGDIVFLVLDEIYRLPLMSIFQVQCDSYSAGCPYPNGYFEAINNDRHGVMQRTNVYINKKA